MNKLSRIYRVISFLLLSIIVIISQNFLDLADYDRSNLLAKFEQESRETSKDLVLIEIDDQSIKYFKQWPWPRSVYAQLLKKLELLSPQIVVFDIDFSSPSYREQDQLFAQQLAAASFPVALATTIIAQDRTSLAVVENLPIAEFSKNVLLANANVILEPSGLVLYYAQKAVNRRLSIGGILAGINEQTEEVLIDYSLDPYSFERVSFKDIVLGNFDINALQGKKFLVGAKAIELGDKFAVPKYGRLPGMVVHALGYESLIAPKHYAEINPQFSLFFSIFVLFVSLLLLKRINIVYILGYHLLLYLSIYLISEVLHHHFKIILAIAMLYITASLSLLWQLLLIIQHKTFVLFKEINRNNYQSALINQMIKDSSNAIVITDVEGRIKVANDKAKNMLKMKDIVVESGEKIFGYLSQCEPLIHKLKALQGDESELTDFIEISFVNIEGQKFYIDLLVSKTMFEQSNLLGIGHIRQQIFDITITDITEKMRIIAQKRQSEIELIALKYNDPLTKLANRYSMNRHVNKVVANYPNSHCLLILVNLDTLTEINQIYGLVFADNVICQVALMLNDFVRKKGKVFRFSEGVFAVIYQLQEPPCEKEKEGYLQDIYRLFAKAIHLQGQQLLMSVSLSMADTSQSGSKVTELINNAVQTLDYVKINNQIDYFIYERSFVNTIKSKALLKNEIIRGINNQEFVMFYQSQHELNTDKLVGVEALIRWLDPQKGLRYPDEFIPIAEEFGMIDDIGELVIELSCIDAQKLPTNICIAINVSAPQFINSDIPSLCDKYLKKYQIQPQRLELEITESMMMQDFELVRKKLQLIQNMGISIAMDDFGTGYSSLQYLTKLPFDKLKIDRSFVTEIATNKQDKALLKSIVSLGFSANKKVLVEGIESEAALRVLKEIGCELGQGYFYSKPQPIDKFILNFALL